jgi:hypothetical protein
VVRQRVLVPPFVGSNPTLRTSWVSLMVRCRSPKPCDGGSNPSPFAKYPGNSVEECFATNEEDGGSSPPQGA